MNNKILLFYLYGSEAFSGTEDKRPNVISVLLSLNELQGFRKL